MIYLFGAGGHAKVVIEILEQQKKVISGLLDDNLAIKSLLDYPVFQEIPDAELGTGAKVIICVGNNALRKRLTEKCLLTFETAIHPSANISLRSSIGEGTVVMASVSVNCSVEVGKHVILNTNCSVDHDCTLKDFVHISPNAALAGNVRVEEGAHIGMGSSVTPGVKIGKWATIGAGAVIIADVPDYAVVIGNPGRIIKYNQPNS